MIYKWKQVNSTKNCLSRTVKTTFTYVIIVLSLS